eukprot:TRINITY_DN43057_c0_g1_i1.p2 TRINITY_DN43057_c0_g1~~TRINITY_DN43057_c0_g1_i1.p2  ORF type:complete len:242 (+),score=-14.38 TRINITY_DN43057_c0_g1_i1:2-727(+)
MFCFRCLLMQRPENYPNQKSEHTIILVFLMNCSIQQGLVVVTFLSRHQIFQAGSIKCINKVGVVVRVQSYSLWHRKINYYSEDNCNWTVKVCIYTICIIARIVEAFCWKLLGLDFITLEIFFLLSCIDHISSPIKIGFQALVLVKGVVWNSLELAQTLYYASQLLHPNLIKHIKCQHINWACSPQCLATKIVLVENRTCIKGILQCGQILQFYKSQLILFLLCWFYSKASFPMLLQVIGNN